MMETNDPALLDLYLSQANLIIPRLERVTPDSLWSHRATGLRRTLMQMIGESIPDQGRLHAAIREGFMLLEHAARDKIK